MDNVIQEIEAKLQENKDETYKIFNKKIVATQMDVIGVKTPYVRQIAKELFKDTEKKEIFYNSLPHKYFEENQIHVLTISQEKDFQKAILEMEKIFPYIDSWATTDQTDIRIFKKNKDKLTKYIDKWLASRKTFIVRFGILQLMKFYLETDEEIKESCKKTICIKSEEYYIKMMQAWLLCTAACKNYELGKQYINKSPNIDVFKMAIRKCLDSYRLTNEQKEELKQLRNTWTN
ncbi:MAG: DNA alkylation repair protein [Clostridia bacterium]|nr:DNA alkylation repair protein [Clostridia bacterium]